MSSFLEDLENIMNEDNSQDEYAILSHAIHIKALRHELKSFFKNDFAKIISSDFKVFPISDPKRDDSDYFYVFKTSSDIDEGSLHTIIGIVNKFLIDHPKDNHLFSVYMERLRAFASNTRSVYRKGKVKTIPQTKIVDLTFDESGNVTRIHLVDCVLLIRLSDHNVGYDSADKIRRNHEIRKSVVDNIFYYNVEDNLNEYGSKEKLGEKHRRFLESEFREKLVVAGIDGTLIDTIINRIGGIVRRYYRKTIK